MINEEIGEIEIKLVDKKLGLKPTFEALCGIESLTKRSLVEISRAHWEAKPLLTDVAAVVYCCHVAYDPRTNLSYDDIGLMILEEGLNNCFGPVLKCIENVLGGNKSARSAKKKEGQKQLPVESHGETSTSKQS